MPTIEEIIPQHNTVDGKRQRQQVCSHPLSSSFGPAAATSAADPAASRASLFLESATAEMTEAAAAALAAALSAALDNPVLGTAEPFALVLEVVVLEILRTPTAPGFEGGVRLDAAPSTGLDVAKVSEDVLAGAESGREYLYIPPCGKCCTPGPNGCGCACTGMAFLVGFPPPVF